MHMRLPFVLAAAALVLSACGGSSATSVGASTDQPSTAGGAGDAPVSDEATAAGSGSTGDSDVESTAAGADADTAAGNRADHPAPVNTQPAVVTTQEAAASAGANQPNLAAG